MDYKKELESKLKETYFNLYGKAIKEGYYFTLDKLELSDKYRICLFDKDGKFNGDITLNSNFTNDDLENAKRKLVISNVPVSFEDLSIRI